MDMTQLTGSMGWGVCRTGVGAEALVGLPCHSNVLTQAIVRGQDRQDPQGHSRATQEPLSEHSLATSDPLWATQRVQARIQPPEAGTLSRGMFQKGWSRSEVRPPGFLPQVLPAAMEQPHAMEQLHGATQAGSQGCTTRCAPGKLGEAVGRDGRPRRSRADLGILIGWKPRKVE